MHFNNLNSTICSKIADISIQARHTLCSLLMVNTAIISTCLFVSQWMWLDKFSSFTYRDGKRRYQSVLALVVLHDWIAESCIVSSVVPDTTQATRHRHVVRMCNCDELLRVVFDQWKRSDSDGLQVRKIHLFCSCCRTSGEFRWQLVAVCFKIQGALISQSSTYASPYCGWRATSPGCPSASRTRSMFPIQNFAATFFKKHF